MAGCFMFQWGGRGGVVFQMGGFIFKLWGRPMGISFSGGGSKKIVKL